MLCLSEKTLLLGPPFLTFLLACYLWDFELNTLTIVYSSSDQSTFLVKVQDPICNFWPLSLQNIIIKYSKNVISFLFFFIFILGFFFLIRLPNLYFDSFKLLSNLVLSKLAIYQKISITKLHNT